MKSYIWKQCSFLCLSSEKSSGFSSFGTFLSSEWANRKIPRAPNSLDIILEKNPVVLAIRHNHRQRSKRFICVSYCKFGSWNDMDVSMTEAIFCCDLGKGICSVKLRAASSLWLSLTEAKGEGLGACLWHAPTDFKLLGHHDPHDGKTIICSSC